MFYPVFVDLRGHHVLVVGGGVVAERKVTTLLEAGAAIVVVSPGLTAGLAELGRLGTIEVRQREFVESDLQGMIMAISATDDPTVQRQVAGAARARNVLVNTVDQPDLCDFIVPAVVRRGDVAIAISTSGKSPAMAAELRARLEGLLTENVARATRLLGEVRDEVHSRFPDPERRKAVFERIVHSGIVDWIGTCDDASALKRIREMLE